jgi:hypothetical protein
MTGYEQLAQQPLGDNILAQIAGTARDIIAAREAVARAEEELKAQQNLLRSLQEDVLPELMAEAGQTELTTIDGLKVSIKENVRGQPSKDNEVEAFAWLRSKGQGGVIKSKLEADLGRASDDKVQAAVEALSAQGIRAGTKESIHWQTLGSLVREMLARGDDVPLDLLGVHIWKQADVKPKG